MADNVAQSIKNLQKNLEALDSQLLKSQKGAEELGKTIQKAMVESGVSVDDFLKAIRTKTNSVTKANKISLVLELTDAKGKPLTAASIQSEISKLTSVGGNSIRINELKDLQKIMGDPAKFYDELMRIVNKMNGGKDSAGTLLGQVRAARLTSEKKVIDDITRQEQKLLDLEKQIEKYKEGGTRWKKTKADIDAATKQLQIYKDKLDRLQGRTVRDNTEKSIKAQMDNMRQLYNLTRQYRQMQESKRKGGIINEQDLVDTRNRLREILNTMKRIETESPGSRKIAATRLETERLRDRWREVNRESKNADSNFEKLLPTLRRLASAFGVAFSVQGLVQFGKKLVETRGNFEMQQVALRSILQNKQLADEIWDKTMQAALQSPFTAMQLTRYTKQMAAYRIESDKLFDTTKRLADVSAGLGVDMGRLILAYGQVKAANFLRSSEIRQFTEAGVNILGELAKYLGDVQGKVVSTAEVMDMVQKRMIKFEAVEEVFKRLTDQGGIFYEMQYIQSQTVKGQINKLHDAYDQMLNNIGKSNEGVIKNAVALMNRIVKNWQEWKTVLDTIAWPLIISSMIKLGKGLLTVGSSARLAAGELKGLELVGTKIRNIVGQTNPWLLLATAITTATFAIVNHVKAVKSIQKQIDEQNLRLYETKMLTEEYQSTLEANNEAIRNGTLSTDELNEKKAENLSIVNKLKNDYPQLAEGMEVLRDGTVKMTDALKDYNEELQEQMTLNYMLGQGGGIFSDPIVKNMQEWETDLSQIKGELIEMQAAARLGMSKMEIEGKTDMPLYSFLKQINDLDISDVTKAANKYQEILKSINSIYGIGIPFANGLGSLTKFRHDEPTVNEDFKKIEESLIRRFHSLVSTTSDYSKRIAEEYNGNVESFIANNTKVLNDGVKDGSADVVKTIRTVLQTSGIGLTEESRKFYNKILNERYKYLLYQEMLDKSEKKSMTERLRLYKELQQSYTMIDFFAGSTKTTPTNPLGEGNGKGKSEAQKMISLLKEMNSEYMKLSKSAYGFAKSNDKVIESFEEAFAEVFKVRGGKGTYIDYNNVDITSKQGLANSLQALYDELARTNSFAKFGKTFKQELLKGIGTAKVEVDLELKARIRDDFARDIEDMFGNYELSLELQKLNIPQDVLNDMFDIDAVTIPDIRAKLDEWYSQQGADLNEEFFAKYQSYIKKLDDEERKLQKQRLKDYSKYLEYQLSERAKVEMEYINKLAIVQSEKAFSSTQKKQIADGLKKEYEEAMGKLDWEDFKGSEFYVGMFEDLDKQGSASLDVMRNALIDLRKNAKNLSPRAMKELVKDLEKIDEIERSRKPPFQRMREEAEKLNKSLNGMDIRDVFSKLATEQDGQRALQDELKLTEEVIGAKTNEAKANEILKKQGKQDIKDLENRLKIQRAELRYKELLKTPESEDVEKFRSETYQINELKRSIKETEEYIEAYNTYQKVQKLINSPKYAKYKGMSLEELLVEKSDLKDNLKLTDVQIQQLQSLIDTWDRYQKAISDSFDEAAKYIQLVNGAISSTFTMMQNYGYATDEMSKQWQSMANALATSSVNITNALKDFNSSKNNWTKSTSNIAKSADWITMIIKVVIELINVIGEAGLFKNARIDKEIQKQQKLIDSLTMAYERLEKSIEKTLTTADYLSDYSQMTQNIYEQISATQAQLAAAQDRKKVDESEVNGYRKSLNDLNDQLDELRGSMEEVFGGIGGQGQYRSWTEAFVSDWRNAFLETGDGLDALEDHFNEFLQSWFDKQATMRIAGRMMEPLMTLIDSSVDDGVLSRMELDRIKERAGEIFPQLNEQLREFYETMGFGEGNGSLSGLAASIQGMTEEHANILEAYWNSVRLYAANIDLNVAAIANALTGSVDSNPMLQQLQVVARNSERIRVLFDSVVKAGHPLGQSGIRVFLN